VSISDDSSIVCQRIRLSGVVQGVGFRPFVWRLAKELSLTGWVRNDAKGLEIEACGHANNVEHLIQRLHKDSPPFARIDTITSHHTDSVTVSEDFFILDSRGGRSATMIGPDTAICRDCLGDMFDPNGRRWRYAFSNCAHCGPRYTICRSLPYDRERTSLKPFAMCKKCLAEYQRPVDRRLHAEGNCCPKCGPQLSLLDASGEAISGDSIANAYSLLKEGKIVAIKGPGGFHLTCDAHDPAAVALMRKRKQRNFNPFPVMFANALSATSYVQVSVGEPGLLNLPERPIILLKKRNSCDTALPDVAPGLAWLGVTLPFSPIHYLLFHEAAGRPSGTDWLDTAQAFALLISSANPSGEPPVIENAEALQRLAGMADAFLVHDREIVTWCDDSIACSAPGGLQLIRRARGHTPRAIKLPHAGPPILAVGGQDKNTVCITRGSEAFISQPIGDLSNPAAHPYFEETIAHLLKVLEVSPSLIAHDLHGDLHSTKFATDFARQRDILTLGVQHHHAHIAAVLAEHHVTEPVISIALDGAGMGADGTLWGGELLRVDGARFERLGHLAPLKLIAGDVESGKPWRLAAAVLHALGRTDEIARRFPDQPMADDVVQQLEAGRNFQEISSMGRLLDAAAGLLGINLESAFRGQAGLLLEGMAECHGEAAPLQNGWKIDAGCLDLMPLFSALADEKNAGRGAAVFHATLVEALVDWLLSVAPAKSMVAASGGCLQNQVLGRGLRSRLGEHGLQLIEARLVPPNDGGLALGQAWVAHQYLLGWGAPE
jgi:hydrogenase maturation protein HypF